MNSNKDKVYESYDKIAQWYDEHRSRELFEKPYLDLAISYLKPGAKILDLGCGNGEPIGRYFIEQGFELVGVDGSKKQIELAKSRFPKVKFIVCDMRKLNLDEKFDLIIAWHSFFHLPKNDQSVMFRNFVDHLKPEGLLIFTSGIKDGEVWSDNGGENLYHASLDTEEYKNLLAQYNFEIITHKIEDPACGDATIWVAQLNLRGES